MSHYILPFWSTVVRQKPGFIAEIGYCTVPGVSESFALNTENPIFYYNSIF